MKDSASMIPVAALLAVEQVVNATLALDPATLQRLAKLEGKVIAIDIQGAGITLYLSPHANGLRLMGHFDGNVDTTLRGTPLSLLRLTSGTGAEGLFTGEITIDGDVETGQQIQRMLRELDIDWEEHVSRLTGDVLGHQLGQAVRGITSFGRNALTAFGLDLGEYLQEERGATPTVPEVEAFVSDVDTLRMAVDRLDARLKRLRHALHGDTSQ